MINKLKVFEIDPELRIIENESEVLINFEDEVHSFFETHIRQSIENKNTKDVRFKNDYNDMIRNCRSAFEEDGFNDSAIEIARNLATNIHSNVTRNFHLMLAEFEIDNDDWILDNEERILTILKMETNNGVQMTDGEFRVRPDMLPDLGNQLQKCGFVISSHIENFDDNNEGTGFHSKIIDKQDTTISNYFMRLMQSVVVADDGESSKIARQFISKIGKKYVDREDKEPYTNQLDVILARRTNTNVDAIITELADFYNEDRLESDGLTIEGLSDTIFNNMRQANHSVKHEFVSDPFHPKKVSLRNDDYSVNISIEESLIISQIVSITKDEEEGLFNITIPEDRINRVRNIDI